MLFNDCIILAGGSGTRLWPASSSKNPKQFLPVPGQDSAQMNFLAASVERGFAVIEDLPDSRVIIISGKDHIAAIIETCRVFSESRRKRLVLIPEPEAMNTAPAIACCLLYSELVNGGSRKIIVLTSDHLISPLEVFRNDASAAAVFTQRDELVVFGIPPDSPNTGYGYIEAAQQLALPQEPLPHGEDYRKTPVYRSAGFKEKPNREKAREFLEAGNHYWNSGMFAFSLKFMLKEFRENAPDLIGPFLKNLERPETDSYEIRNGISILENWKGLADAYSDTQKISFDYAIAETCSSTVMVKASFRWIDVGSWDVYAGLVPAQNSTGVDCAGKEAAGAGIFSIESENTFVDSDIPVALVNANDLIVVIRSEKKGGPKAALIVKKGESQKVQEIIKLIKESGHTELL